MDGKNNQQPTRIPETMSSMWDSNSSEPQAQTITCGQLQDADGQLYFDFMKDYLYLEIFNERS